MATRPKRRGTSCGDDTAGIFKIVQGCLVRHTVHGQNKPKEKRTVSHWDLITCCPHKERSCVSDSRVVSWAWVDKTIPFRGHCACAACCAILTDPSAPPLNTEWFVNISGATWEELYNWTRVFLRICDSEIDWFFCNCFLSNERSTSVLKSSLSAFRIGPSDPPGDTGALEVFNPWDVTTGLLHGRVSATGWSAKTLLCRNRAPELREQLLRLFLTWKIYCLISSRMAPRILHFGDKWTKTSSSRASWTASCWTTPQLPGSCRPGRRSAVRPCSRTRSWLSPTWRCIPPGRVHAQRARATLWTNPWRRPSAGRAGWCPIILTKCSGTPPTSGRGRGCWASTLLSRSCAVMSRRSPTRSVCLK